MACRGASDQRRQLRLVRRSDLAPDAGDGSKRRFGPPELGLGDENERRFRRLMMFWPHRVTPENTSDSGAVASARL
jgi:hypothetical protein